MRKKIFGALAALLVIVALWSAQVSAADVTSGDFTYRINGEACTIMAYTGADAQLVVPAALDGYTVTAVGASAFRRCSTLTEVTLPNTLTVIGSRAFQECTALESVALPASLRTIESSAFQDCAALDAVTFSEGVTKIASFAFSGTALVAAKLPASLETLSFCAFSNCPNLTEVGYPVGLKKVETQAASNYYTPFYKCPKLTAITVSAGVTAIPDHLFHGCTDIKTISLPDTLTAIGERAFYQSGLTAVTIPSGVTTIGNDAFRKCAALESVTLEEGLTALGTNIFQDCAALKTVAFPSSLRTISNAAFSGCTVLEEAALNEGLEVVGSSAFYGCTALTEVNFPGSVRTVGYSAFENCTALSALELNDGLQVIEYETFRGCTALKTVVFSEGLKTIKDRAFYGTALTEVELPASLETLSYYAFANCPDLAEVGYPVGLKEVEVLTSSAGSYYSPFYNCPKLTAITVPEGVSTIPANLFRGCTGIKTISLPGTLTTIEENAFYGSGLTAVTIPSGVTTLEEDVFRKCAALESVALEEGLTVLGANIFQDCTALKTVIFPSTLQTISTAAFRGCAALERVTLPAALTTLGSQAFYQCTALEKVVLNEALESVGSSAFYGCAALTEVKFPASVRTIGNSAFKNCTALSALELNDGLQTIEYEAFRSCAALTEVDFPASLTAMGNQAFGSCTALTAIGYPVGLKTVTGNESSPFTGCSNLTAITVPEGITAIPANLFRSCTALKTVAFTEGLTTIGKNAFYGSGLTSVTLPESLTTLGEYAFYDCESLIEAQLPAALTELAYRVFGNCDNLEKLVVPGMETAVRSGAFNGSDKEKLVIWCYAGSPIYQFAMDNGYQYRLLAEHEHTMEETGRTDPTCEKAGLVTSVCGECGYILEEKPAALGHDYAEEYTVDRKPTCTSTGRESRHCSRCDKKTDGRNIPATGHLYGGWMITKPATIIKQGVETQVCQYCAGTNTRGTAWAIPEGEEDNYGIGTFRVVNAATLAPIANASITVFTEAGEITLVTDDEGITSHPIPVGRYPITVTAGGCRPRSLTINVKAGEQEFPLIGLSSRDPVEVTLTSSVMTLEEIEEAGIDTSNEANRHVYKYKAELTFKPEVDIMQLLYYFNFDGDYLGMTYSGGGGSGGVGSGTTVTYVGGGSSLYTPSGGAKMLLSTGETVSVYPVDETFFLIIYGEVHWLKEMFDVEMLIVNNSLTDTMENGMATLFLPEDGLSLADMVGSAQTLTQEVPVLKGGESHSVHWYIRGDKEGSYDLTAHLSGMLMPWEDTFGGTYTLDKPLKVYAGSALQLTFEVPDKAYYGEDYPVRIVLTNVSDRTLYDVHHSVSNVDQYKVSYYTDGEEVEELISEGDASVCAAEFEPGDQLGIEVDVHILFNSTVIKDKLTDYIDSIEKLRALLKYLETVEDSFEQIGTFMGLYSEEWIDSVIDLGGQMVAKFFEEGKKILGKEGSSGGEDGAESDQIPMNTVFDAMRTLVDLIPMEYVLEDILVTTLAGSTTEIPYEITVYPSTHRPVIPDKTLNVSQLILDSLFAITGEVNIGFGGFEYDVLHSGEGEQRMLTTVNDFRTLMTKSADGETQFRVWSTSGDGGEPVEITARTEEGSYSLDENGEMIFTGESIISVHVTKDTTVYVQAGQEEPQVFHYEVVPEHTCEPGDWQVVIHQVAGTVGLRAKACTICRELMEVDDLVNCGAHTFSEYELEMAPTPDCPGVEARSCTKEDCQLLDFRQVEYIAAEDLVTVAGQENLVKSETEDGEEITCLVLEEGSSWSDILQLLTEPEKAARENAAGEALDENKAVATGQIIVCEGTEETLTLVIRGDVDGDGDVTELDVPRALAVGLDVKQAEAAARVAADTDRDGSVTAVDVARLALRCQGMETDCIAVVRARGEGGVQTAVRMSDADDEIVLNRFLANVNGTDATLFILDPVTLCPLTGAVTPPEQ